MAALEETKQRLKLARERRGAAPAALLELIKENNRAQKAILDALEQGPLSVPEIAEKTSLPSETVFWQINALRKYNKIHDVKKSGDYFTYEKR
jgi:predicted transcriptional regulator